MSTTKLVMEFADANGTTHNYSYNYIDPSVATLAAVKNLMSGMITNGSIFAHVPTTKKAAKLVTTTETNIAVLDE